MTNPCNALEHDIVTLHADDARLSVCPAAGGVITRYKKAAIDYLWPAAAAAIGRRDPLGMSCFPLVPFSGRVRDGRFRFRGREIQLALNFLPQRHAIHGQGWQRPWQITASAEHELIIDYRHTPDAWPWRYAARQQFRLDAERLTVVISVTNQSDSAMPAGIGLHPYFIRTAQVQVRAGSDKIWLNDAEVMPLRLTEPPAEKNSNRGIRLAEVALDNTFTGWDGLAEITWPEWGAGLRIKNQQPTTPFLVVYSPPGERFFCVEPVSNSADAFNLADQGSSDTGMRVLEPGQTLAATIVFEPFQIQ